MIAQRIAISYSERVLSLTSIMSSGYALNPKTAGKFAEKVFFPALPFLLKKVDLEIDLLRQK